MADNKSREIWVDNIKVFACVLVVLGHLSQSMYFANLVDKNLLYRWFNDTIYFFHVPLFFIASGYLYQKYTSAKSAKLHIKNSAKKAVVLGVPYFVFATASFALKTVFSSNVNFKPTNILNSLFVKPDAPYWYLIVLIILFVFVPTFKSKKAFSVLFAISILLFLITPTITVQIKSVTGFQIPYLIKTPLSYLFWFCFGMALDIYNIKEKLSKSYSIIAVLLFLVFSIFSLKYSLGNYRILRLIAGTLACSGIVGLCINYSKSNSTKFLSFCSRYTMPVYLMHTMCAAGVRTILLKLGLTSLWVQIPLGLIGSFALPVVAMIILSALKPCDFIVYPSKYLKRSKKIENING